MMGADDRKPEMYWGEREARGLLSRLGIDVRHHKSGIQARFGPRGHWSPGGSLFSECIENLIAFGPVLKVAECSVELHFACALAQDGEYVLSLAEGAGEGDLYGNSPLMDKDSARALLEQGAERIDKELPPPSDNLIPFRSPHVT